jgi:hypothetical protein
VTWVAIETDKGALHLVPENDLIVHDVASGVVCVCVPALRRVDGRWMRIHHALDGREHRELDHDRDNCPLCSENRR